MQSQLIKFLVIIFCGSLVFGLSLALKTSALNLYATFYVILYLAFRPVHLISPLTVVHAYYFVFFILAPTFAEIHSQDNFASYEYHLAFVMIFMTHCAAVFGASVGETSGIKKIVKIGAQVNTSQEFNHLKAIIPFLFFSSTSLVILIVVSSGGFLYWISAPGDAFLNRAGSGIYVVLSHFSTFLLAGFVGFYSYTTRRYFWLIAFILWLLITSPVHGSKQLISIFLIISLMPWIRNLRLASTGAIMISALIVGIFLFGLYLRNLSWITLENALPYTLNYFSALRNLMLLLEDFEPGFFKTFFLPFNKFLTPFGLSDPGLYFDMNHMLTDKYFPSAWEIRATEQWPVEADLYLNFYFILGLPLIFLYMFVIGRIYGKAKRNPNLGIWVVSVLLIFSITSHLRGSLYNHVDFYLYPMFFVIYVILKKYPLQLNIKIR